MRAVLYISSALAACEFASGQAQITVTAADVAAGQRLSSGKPAEKMKARRSESFRFSSLSEPSFAQVPEPHYPLDLTNQGGLPMLHNFQAHNVFVNAVAMPGGTYGQSTTGPSVGDADTFLSHLFASNMFHIQDEYSGTPDLGARVGASAILHYNPSATTYNVQDLQAIVHAAATSLGTGPGHLFNIFTNQGVDVCDAPGDCYSPDNVSTWTFCAFHWYFDFPDIGTIYFTMQPYANVGFPGYPVGQAGCQVPAGGMHSEAVESMASVLSHETFEATSDPEATTWLNLLTGEEEADLCVWLWYDINLAGGPTYRLQGEYSNRYHACVWMP
jgi:hypothetical protein